MEAGGGGEAENIFISGLLYAKSMCIENKENLLGDDCCVF